MRERVVQFGSDRNLVGILTEPDSSIKASGAPVVVCWNVGIHHHVGPNRLYVDLTRRLAEQGLSSLRFDVSGIGDSEQARNEHRTELERSQSDVQAAMALGQDLTGARQCCLVAFCSGVDAAHRIAVTNSNVAAVVYIEGYRFSTSRSKLVKYTRILDASRWNRWARTRLAEWRGRLGRNSNSHRSAEEVYVRDLVPLEEFRDNIRLITARGTKLMFIYLGRESVYSYQDQLFDLLGDWSRKTAISVVHLPLADHGLFWQVDRDSVVTRIVDWASSALRVSS